RAMTAPQRPTPPRPNRAAQAREQLARSRRVAAGVVAELTDDDERTPVAQVPTAASRGLLSCHACDLVSPIALEGQPCPRCGAALHHRKPASLARTWAFLLSAFILYIPANLLPVMVTESILGTQRDTIMSGVIYLWLSGSHLLAGVVLLSAWWAKVGLGVLAGLIIARLFIIGHDACHQSLTDHRGLNKWLGRLTFLPSLTPYSLWEVGHNVVHHGYTNLKGFDFVWAPYSLDEFRALPRRRRVMERIYRNGFGAGLYYLIEIWWFKLFFPSKRQMATRRAIFLWDCTLVAAFGALWIGALAWLAVATGQSVLLMVGTGFVLPFLVWNTTVGFVLYVHHTHTSVAW
ncbi:UNVERIFIED_CONTAM: fatty acid desaturase, partial [Microbacterium sp. SLM126]